MADFLFREDSIAALSTPPGRGAIGIIRISGQQSIRAVQKLWQGGPIDQLPPRTLSLGTITTESGEPIDEAFVAYMPAPNSYTGEDVVEVHCHGNPTIQTEILRSLTQLGVRPAEPGEFTYRAFRNGRISLVQAESVAQLIDARGMWARKNALSVLAEDGDSWVRELLDALLEIWAPIEADLEFPTDDLDSINLKSFLPGLDRLRLRVEDLQRRSLRFAKLQEGYRVVIAGPTNAGKSSLLNALLGYNRALVTEIPGTTRDTLEETFDVGGIPIRLIDTAGLGEARDLLDEKGQERSRQALQEADLIVALFDLSEESPDEGTPQPDALLDSEIPESCPCLVIGNKDDLLLEGSEWRSVPDLIRVSAKEGKGLDRLLECIQETLTESGVVQLDERIMLNQRQEETLTRAHYAITACVHNIQTNANQDLVASDLAEAKKALEDLSGKTIQPDLLETIFSKFCIGK